MTDDLEPAPDQLLRIGDFARLAGTSVRTLRYYESLGLLEPAQRSEGRFRYYRASDLHRLRTIQSLQQLGLRLERIHELLSPRPDDVSHGEFVARVRAALQEQADLLQARIRELQAHRRHVARALAKLDDCEACALHPSAENDYCNPCAVDGKPVPEDLRAHF